MLLTHEARTAWDGYQRLAGRGQGESQLSFREQVCWLDNYGYQDYATREMFHRLWAELDSERSKYFEERMDKTSSSSSGNKPARRK